MIFFIKIVFNFLCNYIKLKPIRVTLIAILLILASMKLDLFISGLFFRDNFFLSNTLIKDLNFIILKATIVGVFLVSAYSIFYFRNNKHKFFKYAFFLIFNIGIVHGLLINEIAKNHFGRARPFQVKEFGGDKKFTHAFQISDQCKKNCSFVSGDVGIAFCFLILVASMPIESRHVSKKKYLAEILFMVGIIICLFRISLGKHFLSDTLISAIITTMLGIVSYRFIFGKSSFFENN